MQSFFKGIDLVLLFSTLLLALVGVLMIYSTSVTGDRVDLSFVSRQIIFIFLGTAFYLIVAKIDYRFFAQFSAFLYLASIFLLVLTFVFGDSVRGAVRWIDLGFITIQASEIAKPVLILTLATFFSKYPPHSFKNIFVSFLIVLLPVFLVFLQPDLGNATILFGLWLVMVFVAGLKFFHIMLFGLASAIALPVIWSALRDYQKERVSTFLNPESDPLGSGYNIVQSIIAVGSGGLTGKGLGRGTQSQLNFLPEQKTDFIFATTAEQLGFLGVVLILGTLALIIYRVITIFNKSKDVLGSLISVGVATLLVSHIFINIGMNIGIFPVTGITLPLLSFGGSSLLSFMISLGLVNSVAISPKRVFN